MGSVREGVVPVLASRPSDKDGDEDELSITLQERMETAAGISSHSNDVELTPPSATIEVTVGISLAVATPLPLAETLDF
jgi:hypothetical protein